MGGLMIKIITVGTVGYISQKSMKCLGQQHIGETIAFCTWLGISINTVQLFLDLGNSIANSEVVKLLNKIF